jgi:hypothetical protein
MVSDPFFSAENTWPERTRKEKIQEVPNHNDRKIKSNFWITSLFAADCHILKD